MVAAISNSKVIATYRERTKGSAALAAQARDIFPSGITHDARRTDPYGIYVTRAEGSRKWDVDGNEYVDYFGGHWALILGHNHPQVLKAMHESLDCGTHFGSNHTRELEWAQLVCELVPSAERVRFTSSGTEATHLALRLARAATGRRKVARFQTHFHGWHDHMTSGYSSHFDGSPTVGVLPAVADSVVLLPPDDPEAIRARLEQDPDIAAIILEPTGSTFGLIPMPESTLRLLREVTAEQGIVLIFDEVVTGFRVSKGGAQAHYGITPDLTTLAKILAGGLPGGAVVGRSDILDGLDHDKTSAKGVEKIQHQGTYNANPVSAAAGIAALRLIRDTDVTDTANAVAADIRQALNKVIVDKGLKWASYGEFSGFHLFLNPQARDISPHTFAPETIAFAELKANPPGLVDKLRLAMMLGGVDITGWPGGTVSAAHTAEDVDRTATAFAAAIDMLAAKGELKQWLS
ncbi:MAG: aminotransferase class III-fold pyridoxal phosphate-dependent enzyme [Gammaproteobacteria bacterium]|nr:aminotransferase class III-fold pyridoxal phosphate-dependent enzyme [Gammaproteobacteria bacterium]